MTFCLFDLTLQRSKCLEPTTIGGVADVLKFSRKGFKFVAEASKNVAKIAFIANQGGF